MGVGMLSYGPESRDFIAIPVHLYGSTCSIPPAGTYLLHARGITAPPTLPEIVYGFGRQPAFTTAFLSQFYCYPCDFHLFTFGVASSCVRTPIPDVLFFRPCSQSPAGLFEQQARGFAAMTEVSFAFLGTRMP